MYQGPSRGVPLDEMLQCGRHVSPTHPISSQSIRHDLDQVQKRCVSFPLKDDMKEDDTRFTYLYEGSASPMLP